MQIESRKLTDLNPAPYNPRTISADALALFDDSNVEERDLPIAETVQPDEFKKLRCSRCKEWKPLKEFGENRHTKRGYQYSCRTCVKKLTQPRRETQKYKRTRVNQRLKSKYGISVNEKENMIEIQHGLCALCGKPFKGESNAPLAPVVDHDHETGIIRSILHHRCNLLIGKAMDDPEMLEAAARYLRKHNGD